MKTVNVKISNESYKVISDYKLDNNTNTLGESLDRILKHYKKMKGGNLK